MANTLHNAHRAGLAAPEPAAIAADLAPLGTAGAAAAGLIDSPQDKAPKLAGVGGFAGQQKADTADCADGPCIDQSGHGAKEFATLQARLALKGWALVRTRSAQGPVKLHVTRWGQLRELPDLAAVHAFANQVGAKP
jgi:hypothetical protein